MTTRTEQHDSWVKLSAADRVWAQGVRCDTRIERDNIKQNKTEDIVDLLKSQSWLNLYEGDVGQVGHNFWFKIEEEVVTIFIQILIGSVVGLLLWQGLVQ